MKIRSGKSFANILENGDIDHLSHLYDFSNMETQDVLHEPGLDADIEDDLTKYVQSDGRLHSPENTESLVNEKMCIRLGFEKSKTLKTKKDFEAKNENESGNSNQKYSGEQIKIIKIKFIFTQPPMGVKKRYKIILIQPPIGVKIKI